MLGNPLLGTYVPSRIHDRPFPVGVGVGVGVGAGVQLGLLALAGTLA